jgi:hypothetical protein
MDIEGILARYGIDIRDCPDRANLIAMYRSIERLEEHCFAMQNEVRGMQQEIRRLNHELFGLQEQSSHASEPSLRPASQTSQASAPREESKCNPDPRAPHGFARDDSHSAGRYVCTCEGWTPDDD